MSVGQRWKGVVVNGIADAGLRRDLEVQRLRTAAAVEVSPTLWSHLGDDGLIAPVVADIVDRWIGQPAAGRQPLTGPGGYTAGYVAAVESDPAGRPWWQLCDRDDGGRRTVADVTYANRVWTHHAAWLQLIRPTTTTEVPDPVPGGPAGELLVARLRAEATIDVSASVGPWLGNDPGQVAAVVADVVAGWLALPPAERAGLALTGPGRYTDRYIAGVLYANPGDDEYRTEFCPVTDGQPFDWDTYNRAVWAHHTAQLTGAR